RPVRPRRVRVAHGRALEAGAYAVRLAHHPRGQARDAAQVDAVLAGQGVDPTAAPAAEAERRRADVARRAEEGIRVEGELRDRARSDDDLGDDDRLSPAGCPASSSRHFSIYRS